jgi:hypothetical protein
MSVILRLRCWLLGHRWDESYGGLCRWCWDSPDHVEKAPIPQVDLDRAAPQQEDGE